MSRIQTQSISSSNRIMNHQDILEDVSNVASSMEFVQLHRSPNHTNGQVNDMKNGNEMHIQHTVSVPPTFQYTHSTTVPYTMPASLDRLSQSQKYNLSSSYSTDDLTWNTSNIPGTGSGENTKSILRRSESSDSMVLNSTMLLIGQFFIVQYRKEVHQRDKNGVLREQQAHASQNNLGSARCCLVQKQKELYLNAGINGSVLCLNVLEAKLLLDTSKPLEFTLETKDGAVYTFNVATSEECKAWTHCIQSWKHDSRIARINTSDDIAAMTVPLTSNSTDNRNTPSLTSFSADQHPNPVYSLPTPRTMARYTYAATQPTTTHIILVRHGHYINAHDSSVGDARQILSQMGRQQAHLTGKYLETLITTSCPRNRHDELVLHHSDMTRAVETAQIIRQVIANSSTSNRVVLQPTKTLREVWPGTPYASSYQTENNRLVRGNTTKSRDIPSAKDKECMEAAYKKFFTTQHCHSTNHEHNRMTETNDSLQNHFTSESSNSPSGHVISAEEEEQANHDDCFRVIVCHANLIRYFLCRIMGVNPIGMWGHFEVNHCGVVRIDLCPDRPPKILSMNETGHMPQSLITSSEDHL